MFACAGNNIVGFGNDVAHAYENYAYHHRMHVQAGWQPKLPGPLKPHQCTFWDVSSSEVKVEEKKVPVEVMQNKLVVVP